MVLKRLEDKGFVTPVTALRWSDKMDLLAVGNSKGELSLFRLTWQKVWTLPCPSATACPVADMSWRPDGRVIAVSYKSLTEIHLFDIDTAFTVHMLKLPSHPYYMQWIGLNDKIDSENCIDEKFLPPLPNLPKTIAPELKIYHEGRVELAKKVPADDPQLYLLAVAEAGELRFFNYALYPILVISIDEKRSVVKVALNQDTATVSCLLRSEESLDVWNFDCVDFFSAMPHVLKLTDPILKLFSCVEYVNSVIQVMVDNWEDVLGEIQMKLAKFSNDKSSSGSVGDEFLMTLVFGKPSAELLHFLVNDLTSKGCKNLRDSAANTFSLMCDLIEGHLFNGLRAMLFHLQTIYGVMKSRINEPQKAQSIYDCIKMTASVILKANEMLLVIENYRKHDFVCFFKWLYGVVLRLCDEPIPPEVSQMSQRELPVVAKFIKENLQEEVTYEETLDGRLRKAKFKIEKVGQYLTKEDLKVQYSAQNDWAELLRNHASLKECEFIFEPNRENSLRQLFVALQETIVSEFSHVSKYAISTVKSEICLQESPLISNYDLKMVKDTMFSCSVFDDSNAVLVTKVSSSNSEVVNSIAFKFEVSCQNSSKMTAVKVSQAVIYESSVCCALKGEGVNHLVVVDLQNQSLESLWRTSSCDSKKSFGSSIRQYRKINISELTSGTESEAKLVSFRASEVSRLNVSSARRLAAALYQSDRRICFFDLEAEEEDDDDDDAESSMEVSNVDNQ